MRAPRLALKALQMICAVFVVFCISQLGSQWLLLLSSLVVPPFGVYLVIKSPEMSLHKTAQAAYSALSKSRRWLRVDVSICLTMAVVYIAFAALLLYGSFLQARGRIFLILAAVGSLITTILYLLNALLSCIQLRTGTVDFSEFGVRPSQLFVTADHPKPYMTPPDRSLKSSPLSLRVDSFLHDPSPVPSLVDVHPRPKPRKEAPKPPTILQQPSPIHIDIPDENEDVYAVRIGRDYSSPPPSLPRRPPPALEKSETRRIAAFNREFSATANSETNADTNCGEEGTWEEGDDPAPSTHRLRRFVANVNNDSSRKRYPREQRDDSTSSCTLSVSGSESLGSIIHEYETASTLEKANAVDFSPEEEVAASPRYTFHRRSIVEMNSDEPVTPFEGFPSPPTPGFDIFIRSNQHSNHRWPQVTEF